MLKPSKMESVCGIFFYCLQRRWVECMKKEMMDTIRLKEQNTVWSKAIEKERGLYTKEGPTCTG